EASWTPPENDVVSPPEETERPETDALVVDPDAVAVVAGAPRPPARWGRPPPGGAAVGGGGRRAPRLSGLRAGPPPPRGGAGGRRSATRTRRAPGASTRTSSLWVTCGTSRSR